MRIHCTHNNHIWTVESRAPTLAPGLDLIPGRRCLCGLMVILSAGSAGSSLDFYQTAPIASPRAREFAKAHPNLVTWK